MNNFSKKLLVTVVVPGALVALAACSGSGSTESASATPSVSAVSAEQFKADVDQICEQNNQKIEAIFMGLPQKPTEADMQKALDDFLAESANVTAELEAEEPPADLQAQYNKLIADVKAADAKVKAAGLAFFDEGSPNYYEDVETQAAALGLTACAANEDEGESGSPAPSAS